ncbi:MBL fold metallo-hydrolase [Kribbella antibiotica]|uniref:MBL fold metallo-hydrolase n=1 Tax=Kribbella antibiotica TaxID=190195 RepID=A0A4R4ZX49_9ACTN|nr:MBL fold metallo-hydrolase [Kribbella antibiotica]TDD62874.1 MBL fold metallo-hydrolase [Kribbella antibiotica]
MDHQVHRYDERTVIIRQALHTNFEAPFLYLLLGSERALLLDTGTGHVPLRPLIDSLLEGQQLIVAHTHAHGDHVGGDGEFAATAGSARDPLASSPPEVVGLTPGEVATYFGLPNWPEGVAQFDLGDRVLDIFPIPGHHASHIAVYDRATRLLFTGDTVYPGRLYVADWPAFRASVSRLAAFVAAGNPVDWMLGAHIEMSVRPGEDYPMGATEHPDEHELRLAPAVLGELDEVLTAEPQRIVRQSFIVYPV